MLPIVGIPAPIHELACRFRHLFKHPSQFQHFQEFIVGRMVSENRTVAGIHQQFVESTDYDSFHHFMTDSPWCPDEMAQFRQAWLKDELGDQKEPSTVVSLDASFLHHTGEDIYGVYKYWDYVLDAFVFAQRVVLTSLVTPSKMLPLGIRLYHRGYLEQQRLYLEHIKPAPDASDAEREEFNALIECYEKNATNHVKQWELAIELVDEIHKHGFKFDAYVIDGGLIVPELMDRIEEHGQAWISKLAKNRLIQTPQGGFQRIDTWTKALPRDAFKEVHVKTRQGEERSYWCFTKCFMLKDWRKHRVVISYDNPELTGEPVFLVTNKKHWHAQSIVQLYLLRDSIEHFIRDQKQELGFEDSQQRKEAAVRKHWELSFVAHTFLELHCLPGIPADAPGPHLESIGQKCRRMEGVLLENFVWLVRDWIFENRDPKELLDTIMQKRLNCLAN